MFSTIEYIYGLATAVFVAVCIVISVVRWFHTVQEVATRSSFYAVKAKLRPEK